MIDPAKTNMKAVIETLQSRLPTAHLSKLSFCGHTPKKLQAWLDALPKANVGAMAKQLYTAIQEINQLDIDTESHFLLLETVRPSIYYVCNNVQKHYLNQPVILPPKASKVANLAQALQNHLATGYKMVVTQTVEHLELAHDNEVLVYAIHRAITELSMSLLRCYQLYFPTPANVWADINLLYALAEHHQIQHQSCSDSETFGAGSQVPITAAYYRTLLLATAKPNQLRQEEIAIVYQAASQWWDQLILLKEIDHEQCFLINLYGSHQPVYIGMMDLSKLTPSHRYIDCFGLSKSLSAYLERPKDDWYVPETMDNELIQHLINAWSTSAQRSCSRTESKGSISIALGFHAAHHHISQCIPFNALLKSAEEVEQQVKTPYFSSSDSLYHKCAFEQNNPEDVWSQPYDVTDRLDTVPYFDEETTQAKNNTRGNYKPYQCDIVNTSPGGYCVSFPASLPQQVRTNEIIGIREQHHPEWSVGVIRWIKRVDKETVQAGVELLSSNADAIGVRPIRKKGDAGPYLRGLVLPEIKAIDQPTTLLAPSITFHQGLKVIFNKRGEEFKAQLIKQLHKSPSYGQYEYKTVSQNKLLGTPFSKGESMNLEDDFDSIWSSL